MIAPLLAFTLLGLTPAKVEVNVNVKDGDVISGEAHFTVTVDAKDPVTQVEFYVGDDLRDTDSSTPYEFKLDTLGEPEGDIQVTFSAYTTEGDSGKKVLKLKIDNEVSKGAEYHIQKAKNLLIDTKYDEAILAGRVALKAKPDDEAVRLLMARAYLGKGVLDTAQKYAEDVLQKDPENLEAKSIVSRVNLERAFGTVNRGTDRNETLKNIAGALKTAVEYRMKALSKAVDKFDQVTPENRLKYCDALIAAGRYSAVAIELAPIVKAGTEDVNVLNRLCYAYLRMGRFKDAGQMYLNYRKRVNLDAYAFALMAVALELNNMPEQAQGALKEAIANDSQNLGVKTAQAYLAMRSNKQGTLGSFAQDLMDSEGQRPESMFFMGAYCTLTADFEGREKYYRSALLTEPAFYDVYVQMGIDAMKQAGKMKEDKAMGKSVEDKDIDFLYDSAIVYFQTALQAKPEAVEALTGIALCYGHQKKTADMARFARSAAAAGPNYAPAQYMLSVALQADDAAYRAQAMRFERDGNREEAKRNYDLAIKATADSRAALKKAQEADPVYIALIAQEPKLVDADAYFLKSGKVPVITPPGQ